MEEHFGLQKFHEFFEFDIESKAFVKFHKTNKGILILLDFLGFTRMHSVNM